MLHRYLLATVTCVFFSISARADFTTVIDVPPVEAPSLIGSNTQLNVFDGGSLPGFFEAGSFDGSATNIEVNVYGGFVDWEFRAYGGSTVNLFGGVVDDEFDAASGSTVNIHGGWIGGYFDAQSGSVVNVFGGNIGQRFSANAGSKVNISGGAFGRDFGEPPDGEAGTSTPSIPHNSFVAAEDSVVRISGGTFDGGFRANNGSDVTFLGTEFLLDGTPIAGLDHVGDSVVLANRGGEVLNVTLRDGSQRDYLLVATSSLAEDKFDPNATLRLTLATPVPEPSTLALLATATVAVLAVRRFGRGVSRC